LAAAGVILSFGTMLYLTIRGVGLHIAMFVSTAIMAFTSGLSLPEIGSVVWRSFSDPGTLQLAAAVLSIGVFSTVMQQTGFLDRTVSGLTSLLGNVKAAIMAVPALVGTMPVLGGAALSAPLVDKLGQPLDLSPETKAAANLVFRHGMFFVFPFSTSLILTSNLTGFSVPRLIAKMWPMSLALWGVGYFALLHRVPLKGRLPSGSCTQGEREIAATSTERGIPRGETQTRLSGLREFLVYGGPLLLALALGIVFRLPLWLALCFGIGAAVLLAVRNGKPLPEKAVLLKGANLSQVVAMFWIMAFKSFVEMTPVFRAVVDKATAVGVPPAILALFLPLVFGYANASQTATISVLVPVFVPAAASEAVRLGFISLIYGSSFTAYFFSPLHMCQVLTCQYYGVGLPQVYKRNWPVFAGFMVVLGLFYLALVSA
jgi:integral membrane protein (TIGR00529 family)